MTFYLKNFTHIGVTGTTGTGKSTICEGICELSLLNNKSKIIDWQNNKYLEVVGFSRPTRIRAFREYFKNSNILVNGKKLKPHGFPIEIYHPIVTTLPKKLPPCFKLYTLPLDFFTYEDCLRVLTNDDLSYAAYIDLKQEIAKIKKYDSLPAVPTKIAASVSKKLVKFLGMGKVPITFFKGTTEKTAPSANRPIFDIIEAGIFSSASFKYAMNDVKMRNILRDKETITGFSNKYVKPRLVKLKAAVNLYILHKIMENTKPIGGNVVAYARDASEQFPNPRATSDKGLKVMGEQAEDMIKDCRKAGLKMILDFQSPTMIAPGVLKELSMKLILRHNLERDELFKLFQDSPGIDDREWVSNIKRLRNYHYYKVKEGLSIDDNPLDGRSLAFKFSAHLNENEDEMRFLARIFSRKTWFSTKEFIEELREDWRQTQKRYDKPLQRMYADQDERMKAKTMGVAVSDMKILRFLYKKYKEGGKTKFVTFKDVRTRLGMPKGTCKDAADRIQYKGFIKRDEKGRMKLMESGIDLMEGHRDMFGD